MALVITQISYKTITLVYIMSMQDMTYRIVLYFWDLAGISYLELAIKHIPSINIFIPQIMIDEYCRTD